MLAELAETRRQEAAATSERAALAARVEALSVGLQRKDAAAALLADGLPVDGVLGAVAALVEVEPGFEVAMAAALGRSADAVAVDGPGAAVAAIAHLKSEDLGRAALLLGGAPSGDAGPWPDLEPGARYAVDVVRVPDALRPALVAVLDRVALVEDLAAARRLLAASPVLTAVTRDGDVLSVATAAGGSSAQPSLIELQAAVEDAERRLAEAGHAADRLRFAQSQLEERRRTAQTGVEVALEKLHESDAAMAALAEELGQLSSTARAANGEAERLRQAIGQAESARDRDVAGLAELEQRLALAASSQDEPEPDPAERDRLGEAARRARSAEMEARLALRTQEERARSLAGRADALRRAAENERQARARARARRERLQREAREAAAVLSAARYLAAQLERSLARAAAARTQAEAGRAEADAALRTVRADVRALGGQFEQLVDAVHRDELARAEQQMRVDALTERAMVELGLEAEALVAGYGPDQPVPVLARPDGTALGPDDEQPPPVPYERDVQQARLRRAERAIGALGRVNPLALEEFDALEERHRFLSEQLEDLRRTRRDLLDIIADVDSRVEQVFAEAYADVEKAFVRVFARLFPGGEGRLVLTEPGNWLTTGIDVEARPAGKKVKRLSLLSGGERSLVAVAFLVSLFIARPSPFYILDEVEAALDDTNLGRLLEIYEELRASSQLLVITHQKRTMEIADALYGVTMRGDGVSAVISQRLREAEPVVA